MRYALYARYSTDNQSPRSVSDQLRLCRTAVERRGGTVVAEFTDPEISGESLANRPGARAMLAAARRGEFDAVFAEDLDRISRDQEDTAHLYKRLKFFGIALITDSDGEVGPIHIGMKGTVNAVELDKTRAKVRRGQRARAEDGLVPCGLAYGYAVAPKVDGGRIELGHRAVERDHAAVIVRIFERYAAGDSPRTIAKALNAEGVPSPRGGQWNPSTIVGHRKRRNGILWNEAYLGKILWGRQGFVKDPDTGRRLGRANAAVAWVVTEAPDLRIVSDELWALVAARRRTYTPATRVGNGTRAKYLLSGLIRCEVCGGPYIHHAHDRYHCRNRIEKGTCENARSVPARALEDDVLRALRDEMLAPDVVAAAAAAYRKECNRLAGAARSRRGDRQRELAELAAQIRNLVRLAAAAGDEVPELAAQLRELSARRGWLEVDAARERKAVVDLHPQAIAHVRRMFEELEMAGLAGRDGVRRETIEGVRGLVERIDIAPLPQRRHFTATLYGKLAPLFQGGPVSDLGCGGSGGRI